jgi:hypothetical protein
MIRHNSRHDSAFIGFSQASNFGALGALRWAKVRIWHLAAFLAGLASKGQEIDDKLQSNSS